MNSDRILAAIDIGTNSIHMVVVQVNTNLPSMTIIATEKATTRLGERCAKTGSLTDEAMHRSLVALARCQEICRSMEVEEIIAVATSAVRESPNGEDFIASIERELGLRVDLISGQEEARRIYLGVLSALELNNQPHVIIDIGGGSTELILGDGRDPDFLSSTKVGAVRLSDLFISTDPISNPEFERLQIYVRGMLERPTDDLRVLLDGSPARTIGTSGTIETIAAIHAKEKFGTVPNPLQGYEMTFADVERIVLRLKKMNLAERTALVRERRADIILAGSMILLETMRMLQANKITICQRSLREGLIVEWMLEHGLIEDRMRYQSSVRDRNVMKLAEKFGVNINYASQVATLALSLFDQTRGFLHNWGDTERSLLWAAAILHNCGHFVNHSAHHKHSYYLIRNGGLLGYTESEIEAIANLARYHRKSEPRKKHENYRRIANKRFRLFVDQVNPLLRLAVALDRRQIGAVKEIKLACDLKAQVCHLQVVPAQSNDPCTLELWSLDYKKQPFESQFHVSLSVTLAPAEVTPLLV
ncbi:Ppx/GppA phosphatase family protein [Pseudanabaena sp. PCC 6802]|uniref:Ppx/GppA phosphatase family protein n=1 Tax=Pseudanabaena sp. PCC 6802 TaxID=118173 RepID=UPI00034676CD|nr:Ppx/GppA phosphatase family protein [Pseudanabaena sp. PCC 6802]